MVDNVTSLGVSVDTRNAQPQVRALRKELDGLTKSGTAASKQADLMSKSFGGFGALLRGAGIIGGVELVRRSVTDLITTTSQLESINRRLAAFSGDVAGEQAFLTRASDELSTSYLTLADSYSGFLALQKNGLLVQSESRALLTGYASIAKVAAVSNADLERSMFGLNQALSTGTVTTEDYNQAVGSIPILAGDLDKAAGVAAGGFKALVREGQVTSDFFKTTLITALSQYEAQARNSGETIQKSVADFSNEFLRFKENFSAPVSFTVRAVLNGADSVLEGLNGSAENLSRNFDNSEFSAAAFGYELQSVNGELRATTDEADEASVALKALQIVLNPLDSASNFFDRFDSTEAVELLRSYNNGLLDADDATRGLLERTRALQVARVDALRNGDGLAALQSQASRQSDIDKTIARIEQLDAALRSMNANAVRDARATSDEFESLYNVIETGPNLAAGQALLDSILPSREKVRELEQVALTLRTALDDGDISQTEFNTANAAIEKRINGFKGVSDASEAIADKTKQLRQEVEQLNDSYATQSELIQRNFERENERINNALQSNQASGVTGGLSEDEGERLRVEARNRLNEQIAALEAEQTQTEQRATRERDAIRKAAFDEQLAETRAHNERLSQARAIIDPIAEAERGFQAELDALKAQQQFKLITSAEFDTLSVAARIDHNQNLLTLQESSSEQALQAAIANGENVERAELLHQQRLAKIASFEARLAELKEQLQRGLITRQEYNKKVEEAEEEHARNMVGIQSTIFSKDGAIAATNELLSIVSNRYSNELTIARNAADDLYSQAQDATGDEKEELLKRAENADKQAKKAFDDEKKANIARARLAQGLAITQAYSTGATIFDKLANVALVAAGTETNIRAIQAQQFTSSAGAAAAVSNSVSSSSSNTLSSNSSDSSEAGQNITIVNYNGVFGSRIEDQVLGESLKRLSDDGYILDSQKNKLNTQNIPVRNIQIS